MSPFKIVKKLSWYRANLFWSVATKIKCRILRSCWMRLSWHVFEERSFFHSRSVHMLEDFPQLANRVWARNCACVLLLLCCPNLRVHFYGHPSSTISLHSCQKRLCPASNQVNCLGGAPRSEWIWLRTNLLGSEGFVCKMHSCYCRREEAGLHQFEFMLWSCFFLLRTKTCMSLSNTEHCSSEVLL